MVLTRILSLPPAAGSRMPSPGASTPQGQQRRVEGGVLWSPQTKRKKVWGSSTMRPLSSQKPRPHCPHKCPQIVRARASSGPENIWLPLNNMPVGGGGGGWDGGANEEGSAQSPEENLIVWGLPWVLLIKKKNLYLNANLCRSWDGLVEGRETTRH